jgi:glycosyltransferase involved in cell wall biosynthesis
MPKVTVLVAVYNAAPYLRRCLDSLLAQTLRDIQIICIDDASTDESLHILNDFAAGDLRVEVVRLFENRGQAHARNEGLRLAKGEIITMLDSDDWLETNALERMVEAFDDVTDAVLLDLRMVDVDWEEPYPMKPFDRLTGREAFLRSLTWQIHGVYGVRAAIHRRYPYDETCRSYSDDNTTRLHYLNSRFVRCCSGRYYYRQHATSSTHQVSVRRFDYLRANESMRRQLLELGVEDYVVGLYENHRWLNLVDVYMFYHVHGSELSVSDRQYGLEELRRTWGSIDRRALNKGTTTKFGYCPCRWWWLFRLEEWFYFTLRGLLGRNR